MGGGSRLLEASGRFRGPKSLYYCLLLALEHERSFWDYGPDPLSAGGFALSPEGLLPTLSLLLATLTRRLGM